MENAKDVNMKNGELGIVSPWVEHFRKIEIFFAKDPDIRVEYNNDVPCVKIFIDNQDKYEALSRVLPTEKSFGKVILKIKLCPANFEAMSPIDFFRKAFKGNSAVTDIITVPSEATGSANDFNYIVCKKEVVQYHNDTLADPHGTCSTLYQDIARDIFGDIGGVYFCTDRE